MAKSREKSNRKRYLHCECSTSQFTRSYKFIGTLFLSVFVRFFVLPFFLLFHLYFHRYCRLLHIVYCCMLLCDCFLPSGSVYLTLFLHSIAEHFWFSWSINLVLVRFWECRSIDLHFDYKHRMNFHRITNNLDDTCTFHWSGYLFRITKEVFRRSINSWYWPWNLIGLTISTFDSLFIDVFLRAINGWWFPHAIWNI